MLIRLPERSPNPDLSAALDLKFTYQDTSRIHGHGLFQLRPLDVEGCGGNQLISARRVLLRPGAQPR